MSDLAFQSASQLAAAIRDKRVGSLELLELYLERVERYNPALNALIATDFDGARARAGDADAALARGEVWGPLHGLPITVKESFNLAGLPTTWGMPAMANNVPATNALAVDRLRAAGAVPFGKTNVPFQLADWQSFNDIYGTTNNPWDTGRTPGGSSGGSAAMVAAGLTGLDAGSDIGGSIRNPAHCCGIYGHKPTWGILPGRGHTIGDILTPADIAVIGPLARGAEDLALAVDVMAGPDVLDAAGWRLELPAPTKSSLADFRVAAWLDHPLSPVDGEVGDRLQAALDAVAKAGAKVDDTARPAIDAARSHAIFRLLMFAVTTARQPVEDFQQALAAAAELADDDLGDQAQITRATTQYHRDWIAANEERTHLRWRWAEFFADWDVLICPISATTAFPHDHEPDQHRRQLTVNGNSVPYLQQLFWAGLIGLVYLPATVAPVGPGVSGLPVGLQIVGPQLGDKTTIEFARLLGREIGGFVPPPGYD